MHIGVCTSAVVSIGKGLISYAHDCDDSESALTYLIKIANSHRSLSLLVMKNF